MARFGYARVSTREQSTDHQIDALRVAGVPEEDIFIEKISGKLASRPQLDLLLHKLRAGDEVVVTRLRRIGRNHQHLLDLARWFEDHEVDFVVLEQGITTSTPMGRLFFRFTAALAEFDREAVVEGTLDGLAAARARGRVGGRKPKLTALQIGKAREMCAETGPDGKRRYTVAEIGETFGVSRKTIYRHLEPDQPPHADRNAACTKSGSHGDHLREDWRLANGQITKRPKSKSVRAVSDGLTGLGKHPH
jgi:DNA invertase Pin-like site-specific DNA recombinase